MINWWAGKALRGAEMREMAKSELARLAEPIRLVVLEIRRRLGRLFIPRLRSGPGIRYPRGGEYPRSNENSAKRPDYYR